MSWLFSRALVAEYSAGTCSDGEPSAPSSVTPTPQAYWSPGRTTDACPRFRSGMTCERLTVDRGADVLTSFRAAFHARTFRSPAKEKESTASAPGCGESSRESFAKYDRDSSSWKTRQCLLAGGLDEFSETWPRWGSMRNGESYRRACAVPHIHAKDCFSLPTLTVVSCEHPGRVKLKPGQQTCISMELAKRDKWPNGGRYSRSHAAWMMGFPDSWTDLDRTATDKFQQWRHSHGEFRIDD